MIRSILTLIIILSMAVIANAEEGRFTDVSSEKILKFEEDIGYYFGAEDPEPIIKHYIDAISSFEKNKAAKNLVVPHLELAYRQVKNQTNLDFDVKKVAMLEYNLIYAQSQKAPFEKISQMMTNIYQEIFQSKHDSIQKAAMLRTFIYKYKIGLLTSPNGISEGDMYFLRRMARQSETELEKVYDSQN